MQRTIDEIYYQITEGLKIKVNSPTENRFRNKALRIYNHERFIFLKSKAVKLCDVLLHLRIADDKQLKKIKHSQNFEQFREVVMELIDEVFDILELVKTEGVNIKSEQLKIKEINQLTRKYEQDAKLESQKYKKLKNEKDSLLKDIKKIEKELNKYRTPTKKLQNKVDIYIELIKKEPDKIPSPESLADFSKENNLELGRTGWYDLIKKYPFVQNVISALIIEEDKMWEKCGKCKNRIEEIDKEIKSGNSIENPSHLKNQRNKTANNSDRYEKLANALKTVRDTFEQKKNRLDRRREQWKPKIDKVLNKKALESTIGEILSESDYKKLELEIKNTIIDFLSNN